MEAYIVKFHPQNIDDSVESHSIYIMKIINIYYIYSLFLKIFKINIIYYDFFNFDFLFEVYSRIRRHFDIENIQYFWEWSWNRRDLAQYIECQETKPRKRRSTSAWKWDRFSEIRMSRYDVTHTGRRLKESQRTTLPKCIPVQDDTWEIRKN